ncbi:MAG: hypothetical protein HUJ76_13290, partial [Parasporobacterium sp.]|nr:hypothetical protein [Parasporobacterium sp.]
GNVEMSAGNDITTGKITVENGSVDLIAGNNITTGIITAVNGSVDMTAGGSISAAGITAGKGVTASAGEDLTLKDVDSDVIHINAESDAEISVKSDSEITGIDKDSKVGGNLTVTGSGKESVAIKNLDIKGDLTAGTEKGSLKEAAVKGTAPAGRMDAYAEDSVKVEVGGDLNVGTITAKTVSLAANDGSIRNGLGTSEQDHGNINASAIDLKAEGKDAGGSTGGIGEKDNSLSVRLTKNEGLKEILNAGSDGDIYIEILNRSGDEVPKAQIGTVSSAQGDVEITSHTGTEAEHVGAASGKASYMIDGDLVVKNSTSAETVLAVEGKADVHSDTDLNITEGTVKGDAVLTSGTDMTIKDLKVQGSLD